MTTLEARIAQLKKAVERMAAQAALPAHIDRVEAEIARGAAEAAELRIAFSALKSWTSLQWDSLITAKVTPLLKEFRMKSFKLL
jgi:uncharacterized small protein (DUF1192 family)